MGKQQFGTSETRKIKGRSRAVSQSKMRRPVRLVFPPFEDSGRDDAVRALISGGLAWLMAEYVGKKLEGQCNQVAAPKKKSPSNKEKV